MKKEELYFSVEKRETEEIIKSDFDLSSYNNHCIIVNQDDDRKKIVNFCSESYGLVPIKEILEPLEDSFPQDIKRQSFYNHYNYAKFQIKYIFHIKHSFAKEEKLFPFIEIHHSYNNKISFRIFFGLYRLNGENSIYGLTEELNTEIFHTIGNIEDMVEGTFEAFQNFLDKIDETNQYYEILSNRIIDNVTERVEKIIEKTNLLKSYKEDILLSLKSKENVTDWNIYLAFNSQYFHNEKVKTPFENIVKNDIKIFNYILNNK